MTVGRITQAFEKFVFYHPELDSIIEAKKKEKLFKNSSKLSCFKTYAISSPASISLVAKKAILGNLKSWSSK